MDFLPLAAFALSTGFALTVDVGVYALVRFAIRPSGSTVVRFAAEVGITHAILLVAGAAIATALEAALELDFVVDLLALVLLTVVVLGIARRSPTPVSPAMAETKPRNTLSWVAAFALSLDALLVAPAVNGVLGDASLESRCLVLTGITLAIVGFTALYATAAGRMQRWMFSGSSTSASRLARIAHFAELFVFCALWATSALKSIERFTDHVYTTSAWGVVCGFVLASMLYVWRPGASSEPSPSSSA